MITSRPRPMVEPTELDLLPCPFCGRAAALHELADDFGGGWRAMCFNCLTGQEDGYYRTAEASASAWNRRADDSVLLKQMAENILSIIGDDLSFLTRDQAIWILERIRSEAKRRMRAVELGAGRDDG